MTKLSNIKLLAWHNFFTNLRFYAPIAIIYFSKVSDSYALGMMVFSTIMLVQSLLEIPTGIFSDLIGRAKTVVIGSIATFVAVLFYAVSQDFSFLIVGAIFEGMGRAFYSGNNDALLYDSLGGRESEYAEKLGKLSSLFQVAGILSAVLGAFIAYFSLKFTFLLSIIPQLLCIIIALKIQEVPKLASVDAIANTNPFAHLKEALRLFIKNPRLRLLTLASTIGSSSGEAGYHFNSAFIASVWPVWAIGIAKSLSSLGGALSFYTSGKVIKKYQELPILIGSRIFSRIISVIAYGYATIFSPVLISMLSLLFGTITVADSNLKQKEYTPKQRATMASLDSLATSIATAIISVIIGLAADKLNPQSAMLYLQIVQAIPILIYLKLSYSQKKQLILRDY